MPHWMLGFQTTGPWKIQGEKVKAPKLSLLILEFCLGLFPIINCLRRISVSLLDLKRWPVEGPFSWVFREKWNNSRAHLSRGCLPGISLPRDRLPIMPEDSMDSSTRGLLTSPRPGNYNASTTPWAANTLCLAKVLPLFYVWRNLFF